MAVWRRVSSHLGTAFSPAQGRAWRDPPCARHYRFVTWHRSRARREPDPDGPPQPGLTIEFPDDDEPADGGGRAADGTEILGGGSGIEAWAPVRRLTRLRSRAGAQLAAHWRPAAVIGCVVLLIGAAAVIVRQVDAARQRDRDRFTVTATAAAYVPSATFSGLSLKLTLVDRGPAPVSVSGLAIIQPGLAMTYAQAPVSLKVDDPTTITMPAVYKCSPWYGPVSQTVSMYVTDPRGVISLVSLQVPPQTGPDPSNGWFALRNVLCDTPMGIQH